MRQSPDTELIISIAHNIVTQVNPDELFLFPSISARYKQHPGHLRKRLITKDDPLSLGIGDVSNLIAPTVLFIVQQTIVQIGADATQQSIEGFFRFLRKKIFNRTISKKPNSQPALPTYTLDEIKDKAYHTALAFKIADSKAQLIASALVGELATMKKEMEPGQ